MGSIWSELGRCDCCTQPVTIWTGHGGTSSYEPVATPLLKEALPILNTLWRGTGSTEGTKLLDLCKKIEEALDATNSR